MTEQEMMAIVHHPGWADGREGFLWCRFDATVYEDHWLRAELTWDDGLENHNVLPGQYFDPILYLESNQRVGDSLVTEGGDIRLTAGLVIIRNGRTTPLVRRHHHQLNRRVTFVDKA